MPEHASPRLPDDGANATTGYIYILRFHHMSKPTLAQQHVTTKPSIESIPPRSKCVVVSTLFDDGSVHTGIAKGDDNLAAILLSSASDLYGSGDGLVSIHEPMGTIVDSVTLEPIIPEA